MKERLIDNCILYVLGIFLMIGMSGWVRPVIVVLIALLHITLSDLIPGKRLRYIEMGAFVGSRCCHAGSCTDAFSPAFAI